MISDQHRNSLQSLESIAGNDHFPRYNSRETDIKRVKHGPTTVIQIPEKRRKVFPTITSKQIVEALVKAVCYKDRREAVCTAIASFDHNIQSLHDEELKAGADAVLTKHLGFLISKKILQKKSIETSLVYEISCTCEALEMVYRASPFLVSHSFNQFGLELLALLIHLINDEILGRVGKQNKGEFNVKIEGDSVEQIYSKNEWQHEICETLSFNIPQSPSYLSEACRPITEESCRRDNDVMLRKATKIIGHFARVGSATRPIAYYPGLLPSLTNLLLVRPFKIIPVEARLNSLWILANLACNSENMVMMACQPNLLSALIAIAARKTHSNHSAEVAVEIFKSHSIASRAILNLSWSPENKIPMSENISLLKAITPLAVYRQSPFGKRGRTVNAMMLQTRKHSLGALRNLASAPRRNKIQLCNYSQGKLLNILTDVALNDPDIEVKERAFTTIQNLATHDTAELMMQNPALILAMKDALLSNYESLIKKSASSTLLVLERSITPSMLEYQTLRELLDSLNPNDETLVESQMIDNIQITSV